MTVRFLVRDRIEVFTVVVVLARWKGEPTDCVDTVRVQLDRPYRGRTLITLPADCLEKADE